MAIKANYKIILYLSKIELPSDGGVQEAISGWAPLHRTVQALHRAINEYWKLMEK